MNPNRYLYLVKILLICLSAFCVLSFVWLPINNGQFETSSRKLKLLVDNGSFSLVITNDDTLRALLIPNDWLIDKESEEQGYVSGFNYDSTITVFKIGNGLTGIHLSSYEIQKGGSAQAAAGRDVFLVMDEKKNELYPGLIDLGITKDRVRSAGNFYATNTIFLLADINGDGFKDIGTIKEDLQFSPVNQMYSRYPTEWYIFKNNRWNLETDSRGIFPPHNIVKFPLIGLSKSPVDYIKEVYLDKNICILDYDDFGIQAMVYELLGYQWYQWNRHGDPDPNGFYDIKVVVHKDIPRGKVEEFYPVIKELEQDFRYVEYTRALSYINRQIRDIVELQNTGQLQEDTTIFKNLRTRLMKTRHKIISKLNNNYNSEKPLMRSNIKKISYRFEDSSVPPEFHRSYTITVSPEKATIIVDSYGDILAEKTYKIRKKQFLNIITSLDTNNIRNQPLENNSGCVGGTSEFLSYWDEKSEIFSASVFHCGGIDSGDLGGNIKAFADDMKKLIPTLDELLK